ncbi:hypothetical protein [Candidatus Magnetominusculus dajiuhuensis]|uniref:hypothetical protein n=1 Tax=Candidatus Magnetominusculus dajiuhuensis TaxID=3137712 RepID=UPI003B42B5AA
MAYAERDWHAGIHERVAHAKERIEHGIRDGSLTHHEAKRLHGEFDRILGDIDRMKAEGRLTHHDKERVHHELDRLESDISKLKHNDERRH